MNEGFPTIFCGNIIASITQELNATRKDRFTFDVLPIINDQDIKKKLLSDYVIFKVNNKKTIILFDQIVSECTDQRRR